MLKQRDIDQKIAQLEAEEATIMSGGDATDGRLARVRTALRTWRAREPAGPAVASRLERINRVRVGIETNMVALNIPAALRGDVASLFDRLCHNVGLNDPIAEDTIVSSDIGVLQDRLNELGLDPDFVKSVAEAVSAPARH